MKEFGAKLTLQDKMSDTLKRNIKQQQDFSKQVNNTRKSVQNLGNTTAKPEVNIDDKTTGKTNKIRQALKSLSNTKALSKAEVDDKASKNVANIKAKLKSLAVTYTPIVRIKDTASQGLAKVKNTLGRVGKTVATPFIRVKDMATNGLNKIRVGLSTVGKIVASPFVRIKDMASAGLSKVGGLLKGVGSTVAKPFIAIKDGASKVLGTVGNALKSVGSTVARATVAVKDGASKVLSGIGSTLKTLAKGATIALTVSGAGLGMALKEGADLQQSIGGVETLFKDSASTVIENANNAFKTAGLSANEYMENVTSFSASLLSSLGGDTAKSAEVADMAMTDMADNANKFGTDMESIQNAYQGFAKQNYTMLDNLKLGYGGTKEEMSRLLSDAQKITGVKYDISNLSDVYNAIHVIQDNLGVTGTTAKEASSTFSGAFASMKASFSNFMGELSVGDNDSVATAMNNLISTATTFVAGNLIPMVTQVFTNLPSAIGTALTSLKPQIEEKVKSVFNTLGVDKGTFSNIKKSLNFSDLLPDVQQLGGALQSFGKSIGKAFVEALPTFINMAHSIGSVLIPAFTAFINVVKPIAVIVINVFRLLGQFIGNIFDMIKSHMTSGGDGMASFGDKVVEVWAKIEPVISTVLDTIVVGLEYFIFTILPTVAQVIGTVIQTIITIVQGIVSVITAIVQTIIAIVQGIVTFITTVVNTVRTVITTVVTAIQTFISGAITVISTVIQTIKTPIEAVQKIFQTLWTKVKEVFENIKSKVSSVMSAVTGFISPVVEKIQGFIDKIGNAIQKVKDFGSNIGGKISSALGFAYGKNRVPYDNYPARLHQGERVLTRVEADQYDEQMGTRGVHSRAMGTGIIAKDNTLINAHQGEKLLTKQEVKQQNSRAVTVEKLADQIVVREDADIDKIVNKLVKRLEKVEGNVAFA